MLLARDERLVEFSFASRFESDVDPQSILRVARQSWSENVRTGVSGFLRLKGDRIEQTIEGPSTVILGLASRILTDRRHCEIVIRQFGPIAARRFADWTVSGLEAIAPASHVPDGPRAALRVLTGAAVPPPLQAPAQRVVACAT